MGKANGNLRWKGSVRQRGYRARVPGRPTGQSGVVDATCANVGETRPNSVANLLSGPFSTHPGLPSALEAVPAPLRGGTLLWMLSQVVLSAMQG
jgi:hypothetical protein